MNLLSDADAALTHDGARVELYIKPGATTARDVVDMVVLLFADMGATPTEQTAERHRLCTDTAYFDGWCRTLPMWCPGAARFVA